MDPAVIAKNEQLKRAWTDQLIVVNPDRPELTRFAGIVGRVITVNWNNKAVVDFQDGGWYDISPESLVRLSDTTTPKLEEARAKYDPKANSAQPIPEKQG